MSGAETCTSRVRHHLSRIQQGQHLNAFLSVYGEEALKRAGYIDQKIKEGTHGPLAGLVVGLKDVFSYEGHPLQASSKILNGFQAQYNATAVQRLLDADAIVIGRQNCDEFGMGSSNENSAFGPVLHPINHDHVPGGSSGGSAVAVASDMCQVSLGSDTGGSVRQPAAFCGVTGLKPTYSRISRYGLVAYGSSLDCVGLLGSDAEDIARVLSIIAGPDEYDSTVSGRPVNDYLGEMRQNEPLKIAYAAEMVDAPVLQPEIKVAMMSAIDRLTGMGHSVTRIDFPLLDYILPTYYILATAEASSNLSRYDGVRYGYRTPHPASLDEMYKRTRSEGFGQEVKRRILLGTFVLTSDYFDAYYTKAQKVRTLIRKKTKEILDQFDFLLMPTAPTTAFKRGMHARDPLQTYLADLYSVQANVAGVPAISFPFGKDKKGLPIGLQALAGDFQEGKLLRLASLLTEDL